MKCKHSNKQQLHNTTLIPTTYVILKNFILEHAIKSVVHGDVTNVNRLETGFHEMEIEFQNNLVQHP